MPARRRRFSLERRLYSRRNAAANSVKRYNARARPAALAGDDPWARDGFTLKRPRSGASPVAPHRDKRSSE